MGGASNRICDMHGSPRNLDDVRRNMEQTLAEHVADASGWELDEPADTPAAPAPGRDTAAKDAARLIRRACHTSAADIQKTGETVVQIADAIFAETKALADLLRRHGARISSRIEEFTAVTQQVTVRMEAVRNDVVGMTGTVASLSADGAGDADPGPSTVRPTRLAPRR
jgi:hypothetical protein